MLNAITVDVGYKMAIRKKQMRKHILESFPDPGIRFYGMADVTYCLVYNFEDLKLVWGMLRLFLNKPHTVHNLSTWKTKGHSHHYHLIKTKPMNTFIQDKMREDEKRNCTERYITWEHWIYDIDMYVWCVRCIFAHVHMRYSTVEKGRLAVFHRFFFYVRKNLSMLW